MEKDDFFERWWAAMPERKLELIEGQLIISTLAGSRRIAWNLLDDHGPAMALPMAAADLWWEALRQAFNPHPMPQTSEEWAAWAATFEHNPEPPPAGPHDTLAHRHAYDLLSFGLHHFVGSSGRGGALGRDFVVRLGENGLTPDVLFVDQPLLADLHEYYFDGPPSLVIEITLEDGGEQERDLKLRLYEEAKVPEYWLIEAASQRAIFFCLEADGRYQRAGVDSQGIYHSAAVPGLALSLPHLWTMQQTDWSSCLPFLTPDHREKHPASERQRDPGELGWDSVSFAPRAGLQPVPIRFEEFISWCPEAKFENLGSGLVIGGSEGARRCLGMLLMTFGLVEVVKLATPREWVAFLHPEPHEALLREHTEALVAHAEYRSDEFGDEAYVVGTIPELPGVYGFGDDQEACRHDLVREIRNLILLRIARGLSPGV